MSDLGRARVWIVGEAAAVAAAIAASAWALQGVDRGVAEPIVVRQSVGRTSLQPEHPVAGSGAVEEGAGPVADGIWPIVKRHEQVQAKEAVKVAVPPPLELLGILTSREGRAIGAMMYDGRTDETMVLELGGERAGIRVLAIEARGIRLAFEGVEYELELARGS